jgi:Icc-related predicted phosphoesterase
MTKLAVLGDIHTHWQNLSRVLDRVRRERVDGILMVGDLACAGRAGRRSLKGLEQYAQNVQKVLERVRKVGPPVVWVPGNHDLPYVDGDGNIDGKGRKIGDLRIAGIGGSVRSAMSFPYEWVDEPQYDKVPKSDVILAHCPPARTPLDWVPKTQKHVGSEWIRGLAQERGGVLVCGHIHESFGFARIGDCLCMNVGGIGHPFGRPQVGFVFGTDEVVHEDLESGRVQRWQR